MCMHVKTHQESASDLVDRTESESDEAGVQAGSVFVSASANVGARLSREDRGSGACVGSEISVLL